MANKVEEKALSIAESIAEACGVYIVDVSYGGGILCYYIDCDGGVDIDKCEEFSRAVEVVLDTEDIIENEYSLEVSSPGVDRKLKKEREFMYYLGREVEVKLYAAKSLAEAAEPVKEFDGILSGYRDKKAVVTVDGTDVEIPLKEAVYIRLKFVF